MKNELKSEELLELQKRNGLIAKILAEKVENHKLYDLFIIKVLLRL